MGQRLLSVHFVTFALKNTGSFAVTAVLDLPERMYKFLGGRRVGCAIRAPMWRSSDNQEARFGRAGVL